MNNIWNIPIKIKYTETEELINTPVDDLFFDNNRVNNALKRNNLFTLGKVLENWGCLQDMPKIGVNSAKEARACIFAYMVEKKYINLKQMVELRGESAEAF